MRTDVFQLTLLLWSFSSGWHGQRRACLHRASSFPAPSKRGSLGGPSSTLHFEGPLASFCFLQQRLGIASTAQHQPLAAQGRGPRNHVDHLSLVTAKLLLHLQQHRACKFSHTEHLSLPNVVGDHQNVQRKVVTQIPPRNEQLQLP